MTAGFPPLVHGLPPNALPYFQRAVAGDPKALLEIAESALAAAADVGEIAALCAAEIAASLAAVAGGEEERRLLARILIRQSALLTGDERAFALRQAESLLNEIGDAKAARRIAKGDLKGWVAP